MVNIISRRALRQFINDNPQFESAIEAWISIVSKCKWEKPQDIASTFGSKAIDILGKKDNKPSTLSSNRVVFDIKGNHIRIIAKYQFHPNQTQLYIKWIGTHRDYDNLCSKTAQYDVEMFKTK